jgi:hypothetical protein
MHKQLFFFKFTCTLFLNVFVTVSFSSGQIETKAKTDSVYSFESLVKLIQRGENDSVRIAANQIFLRQVRILLQTPESLEFDSLKNVSTLVSPNKDFRVLTWTLPSYEGSYSFFGFIQTYNKKTKEIKVYDLVDSTEYIEKPEAAKLTSDKWFGAVYYKLLSNKKDGKLYYTLLGWKGKNQSSTQKVIDVLYFSNGKPVFGYPFLKLENVYRNRMIFEYAAQAVMSLRYEESKKLIVFDHISSPRGSKNSDAPAMVNGPDGSYDALKFKGGKWIFMRDIDIRTTWKPKKQPKEPQIHEAPVQMIK